MLKIEAKGRIAKVFYSPATNDKQAFINVTLVHNPRRKNDLTGEWEDDNRYEPIWLDIPIFGGDAEWYSERLQKGDILHVVGKLDKQTSTSDQGVKHSRYLIRFPEIRETTPDAGERDLAKKIATHYQQTTPAPF